MNFTQGTQMVHYIHMYFIIIFFPLPKIVPPRPSGFSLCICISELMLILLIM